ncbi:DNA replication factor C complex subunit Rfc1 [Coemansia biformis]|uniref:Replication factor C subunit 1 n=1 Tax=Coemansia biformis TaxID=1286918 RepID=A0A9W7YAH7_9FUNG|nr:DNA replication factor C complex subunit Rfc1 [Coemansia biformis]
MFTQPTHQATAPGSMAVPEGAPGCLDGLKFVVTGEFSSMSREQITDMIRSFGGQITGSVSGRTSYLVVGDDPGSTKVKKAKAVKTRCLYESGLLALIGRSKPEQQSASATDISAETEEAQEPVSEHIAKPALKADLVPKAEPAPETGSTMEVDVPSDSVPTGDRGQAGASTSTAIPSQQSQPEAAAAVAELWTEKYKPTKLKELCGQKEHAKRLLLWLGEWASGAIPEARAVLISGPPGIGKTTTAHLVAKLAGFNVLELNASETRNKTTLKSMLGSAIGNRCVLEFDRAKVRAVERELENEQDRDVAESLRVSGMKRMVVIMDEVDGMSGGDRGGNAELIQLIKRTRVPIICICNDRQSPKVRSLAAYCEDMRFRRPTEAQMRARINTIAFRENLRVEPNAIVQLVKSTHNDIRQIINLLSSYALKNASMSYMESKAFASANRKEVAVGPFDAIQKYLNCGDNMEMSFADKIDLYYSDYSIMPLFMQENYIDSSPNGATSDLAKLEQLSKAADMIAESDVVEGRLRGSQQWGLMPLHAVLSCVGPAFHARGRRNTMIRFPGWLGQNSKGTRLARQLREVQGHMRLRMAVDKTEVRLSYVPALVPELTQPLINQGAAGIPDVVSTMDHYYLTKEHWDVIAELHMDGERILKQIPTAVKTAFTRTYNKGAHPVAFQEHGNAVPSKRAAAAALAPLNPDDEAGEDDVAQDSDTPEDDDDDTAVKPAKPAKPAAKRGKAKDATAETSQRKRRRA